MSNFKVGDFVRIRDDATNRQDKDYLSESLGEIGEIIEVTCVSGGYLNDGWLLSRFEKVEQIEEEPFEGDYIIVAIDDGAYAPAETPRVFDSEHQAMVVAEKMAKEYDAEFAVFKRVAVLSPEGAEFDEGDAVIVEGDLFDYYDVYEGD
jgi:hypothetical protein